MLLSVCKRLDAIGSASVAYLYRQSSSGSSGKRQYSSSSMTAALDSSKTLMPSAAYENAEVQGGQSPSVFSGHLNSYLPGLISFSLIANYMVTLNLCFLTLSVIILNMSLVSHVTARQRTCHLLHRNYSYNVLAVLLTIFMYCETLSLVDTMNSN